MPALEGLAVEAVEWLPSGSDAGLVRVRGRWTEPRRREPELPALGLRRGEEARRFESLPDARFGRDPALWRATYLVPAALMDPDPDGLWLSWESGVQTGLPAPTRGFEPPATASVPAPPDQGGEVIDRAVLAERRARRAEAAERTQAQRAAEALEAVEVLELRSAELERRLEALRSQVPARSEAPASPELADAAAAERPSDGPAAGVPAAAALMEAVAAVKRLRGELGEQRERLRKSELLRAADAVALASFREAENTARRLRQELAARERELAAIGDELAGVRTELATVRHDAAQRAADLESRLTELDAALAAERRAQGIAATERETARAGLALAESARSAESVARAALDDELDRERLARATLIEALDTAHAELTAANTMRSDLVLSREQARAEAAGTRAELEAARAQAAAAEASLRAELEAARAQGGLTARIAELERAADDDLERRASEQADAAAAVAKPTRAEQRHLSASLDAAAAALRARPARAGPIEATPEPAGAPPQPRITAARHLTRAGIVGASGRDCPWLRGALVRLAREDPRAATRLVLGLVPVQRALVEPPLEYDLTIRGAGTYAISVAAQGAAARSVRGPRPREEAAFHVAADIVTLAELLAGVDKRMGRWLGSVKVHGRRRGAHALRAALTAAELDLAAAARAGADLDPDLVLRALAYAIHPSWTKGHTFVVAQEISGPRPMRWHVAVRDGAPVSVERRAPEGPPDAVIEMSRAAYSRLLRGEPAPSGERPAIRGDRAAVALLKAWTDRAQGRAG